MPDRVFITGLGLITAIGKNFAGNLSSLLQQESGIGKVKYIDTLHRDDIPVAEVRASDEELSAILGLDPRQGYTRTALLSMIAAQEALQMAGVDPGDGLRNGVISATTVGGMVKSENYYLDFLNNDNSNVYIGTHDCGDATEKVAFFLGFSGFMTTISTACSSSINSIMLGARMIRNGLLDRALVGGADAMSKFTINGFNTLMILDREGCKPFDQNRNGLTLGEGAAFLMLESEKAARLNGKKILAEVSGWGNANDAFHQTASSPEGEGAVMAMRKALTVSNLKPEDIDYINAHGTGTINNDLSEGKAIETIFGDRIPFVSSTKPYTGHTLGAAGAVETVFSVMAIQHNLIFPNMGFKKPMEELHFTPVTELIRNRMVNHVLTNSFGFGGNNSTLILSRPV
ncbi:MAG: beta-ketoacyl-[acyl-carrier-protein] synthase family protein [Bacteroidetes bacterium]|nr:beta-ketoacyl-[acyl-carrier-protein] synthase family protein [Bacteroidota bacterium]